MCGCKYRLHLLITFGIESITVVEILIGDRSGV